MTAARPFSFNPGRVTNAGPGETSSTGGEAMARATGLGYPEMTDGRQ
jgi:hypothetical protein